MVLMTLGIFGYRDEKTGHWFVYRQEPTRVAGQMFHQIAAMLFKLAREHDAMSRDEMRATALAAKARFGDLEAIYTDLAPDINTDDVEDMEWWQTVGSATFEDFRARFPIPGSR
jgi:hypothetical protein